MKNIVNADMAAAWDGPEGEHWAEHADHYEAVGTSQLQRMLHAAEIAPDAVVLDVGCGTGKSTRAAARLAPDGSALGVDLSSQMLDVARARAAAEGLTNVTFEQADAQVHPFGEAAHDVVLSSFGAMFFADPKAAFTNLAQSTRPGGRLSLLTWRELARNEWLVAIRAALAVGRQLPEPPTGMPGPFGLADGDHVQAVLGSAGFSDITLEVLEEPLIFGRDAEDAFAFFRTNGMVRGMTQDLSDEDRARAIDGLRQTLVDHQTDDGVTFGSSAWLITAQA